MFSSFGAPKIRGPRRAPCAPTGKRATDNGDL